MITNYLNIKINYNINDEDNIYQLKDLIDKLYNVGIKYNNIDIYLSFNNNSRQIYTFDLNDSNYFLILIEFNKYIKDINNILNNEMNLNQLFSYKKILLNYKKINKIIKIRDNLYKFKEIEEDKDLNIFKYLKINNGKRYITIYKNHLRFVIYFSLIKGYTFYFTSIIGTYNVNAHFLTNYCRVNDLDFWNKYENKQILKKIISL